MPFRVLVVDDQTISRQLFESFIASSERYELAASVSTARYADSYCAAGKVDLVLMDVVMNDGSNGLDTAERIKKSYPDIKIIAVTSMPDSLFLSRARRIGVDSFWYKEAQ
ncbi:MAG: response regulator transcription factor, partial [Clostridia bacterium]|nr:response regulator transcription factor [Clostridia bacterium]